MPASDVDQYIAAFPVEIQEKLNEVRRQLLSAFPGAVEDMAYGVPTIRVGKKMVHYAAFKNHLGFYPSAAAIESFSDELTDYSTSKGTIRFPLNKPVPVELIVRIAKYRMNDM